MKRTRTQGIRVEFALHVVVLWGGLCACVGDVANQGVDGSSIDGGDGSDVSADSRAPDAALDGSLSDASDAGLVDSPPCTHWPDGGVTWGPCLNFGVNVQAPATYCTNWAAVQTTPAPCRACRESYTCACLIAQNANNCSFGYTWSCDDTNGHLTAQCLQ